MYGHLPPITKTTQVRRTRNAGHFWRSKDELISDTLLWTPSYGRAKVYIYIYIYKLVTINKDDPKAPLSLATIPSCKGQCNSFPWIAPFYPWSVPYRRKLIEGSVVLNTLSLVCVHLYKYIYTHVRTHTHTHTHTYIYIQNISSSSSCRAVSTDIPDHLPLLLPIIHRLRQVFRVTSCVFT